MEYTLDKTRIPSHVAIIMDGNGRWAKDKGKARLYGHNAGMQSLKEIVKHSDVLGVKFLTVYAFSTENWKRPADEVGGIFKLLVTYVNSEIEELHANNVRVNILGDYSKLPTDAKKAVDFAIERTSKNTGLRFNIALNYGGRAEIIKAAKDISQKILDGSMRVEDIDEDSFSKYLYTKDIPDPELIIRTSGEMRLSNFLTWQSAYSELVVTSVYWPDFTPSEYERCIAEYQNRDRRFGGIK